MAPTKAAILFTAWNVIDAISNMWDKLGIESLDRFQGHIFDIT